MRRRAPSRTPRRVAIACAAVFLAAWAPGSAWAQAPLSPDLVRQIGALLTEKAERTPAQRKLSSQLLYESRIRQGLPVARGVARLRTDVEVDAAGRVLVDVRARVSSGLLRRIGELGGTVVSSVPRFDAVRARLPLAELESLAQEEAVRAIHPADRAYTRKLDTSEGDGAHFADDARTTYGIDGTGVTVGVLSDGVDSLASIVSSGDLPAGVSVLPGQAGSGDEGTAMLEIVYDLAPGANLLFATAFTSQASFASNILALRSAGADVIVDDVGYFAEAVFQDDDVASAVDQVVADGALYFSAAGNSGNLNDGTAGVWEGDFVAGSTVNGSPAHDYGGGDITNEVTNDSPYAFTLHWSDPLGASSNDYDLFLTNKPGTVIFSASTDVQNGSGDPYEIIGSGVFNDAGRQLIVVRDPAAADRYFHLNANRGALEHVTSGQIGGHPGARGAWAVAAVDARGHTAGFTGTEPVETYSSDGPRRVFFESDGTAITPGDFSSTGGELRAKPELAAADCVSTATPGFDPFCGTSAAGPHAAAIAALLIERGGGPAIADPAAVLSALSSTALDIEAPGDDRDSGAGIAEAVAATGVVPVPECFTDPDCDDGAFCNGAETCVAGTCVDGADPACVAPTPFCDESLDACTACLVDADCNDGAFCNGLETCSGGACLDGTAPCVAPTPFCDESLDVCNECLADADCNDGAFCNGLETCSAGACLDGAAPVCVEPTPFCDESLATCSECLVDTDCAGSLVCDAGMCRAPQVPAAPPAARVLVVLLVAAAALLRLRAPRRR